MGPPVSGTPASASREQAAFEVVHLEGEVVGEPSLAPTPASGWPAPPVVCASRQQVELVLAEAEPGAVEREVRWARDVLQPERIAKKRRERSRSETTRPTCWIRISRAP